MDNVREISLQDFERIFTNMITFQRVHNELRKDFQMIYELAKGKIEDTELIKPLIRSCYKELFSLIEADIYLLNQFNPYSGYQDKHDFVKKFKQTFKHHSNTFNKQDIVLDFNSLNFELLLSQKHKRDEVTHPKGKQSIEVNTTNLEEVYSLYERYN